MGPVVQTSVWRTANLGSIFPLSLRGSSHTTDLETCSCVGTLPGGQRYRVGVTGSELLVNVTGSALQRQRCRVSVIGSALQGRRYGVGVTGSALQSRRYRVSVAGQRYRVGVTGSALQGRRYRSALLVSVTGSAL